MAKHEKPKIRDVQAVMAKQPLLHIMPMQLIAGGAFTMLIEAFSSQFS